MSLIIRDACRDDIKAVWGLIVELAQFEVLENLVTGSEEKLHDSLFSAQARAQCIVAELDSVVVEYAITFATFSTFKAEHGMWLEDLYVTPLHRSSGIGKILLDSVRKFAREQNCARLEWSVLDWNIRAIKFYESQGAELLPDWKICRILLK